MTLRDLTKRQLYNLRRRCEKERKNFCRKCGYLPAGMTTIERQVWEAAYNLGLKAGLSLQS